MTMPYTPAGQAIEGALIAPTRVNRHRWSEILFREASRLSALAVLATLGGMLIVLFIGAWPAFERFGIQFIWSQAWDPIDDVYGALPVLVGTLLTSILALLVAVPISFGIAVYVTQMAPPWIKRPVSTAIELLAAIPSIIYGMWGIVVFMPFFRDYIGTPLSDGTQALAGLTAGIPVLSLVTAQLAAWFTGPVIGQSTLAAGLVLAIMIIPFISAIMREVLDSVPPVLRESAFGMGGTLIEVVWTVLVPYCRASLVGGILLGLGRALGETMAVTFIIGNDYGLATSLLQPATSIAASIASEFAEAVTNPVKRSALIAIGFLLFVLSFVVLALSRVLLARLAAQSGQRL